MCVDVYRIGKVGEKRFKGRLEWVEVVCEYVWCSYIDIGV